MVPMKSPLCHLAMRPFACLLAVLFSVATVAPQARAGLLYSVTDLGTLGGLYSEANGIDSSGKVVGEAYPTGSTSYHAFRTMADTKINPLTDDLGTLGGTQSYADGINSTGQVVGYAYTTGNAEHAFRTAPNAAINSLTDDLGTLGGTWSCADGINSSGQVVGYAGITGDASTHAFRTAANAFD